MIKTFTLIFACILSLGTACAQTHTLELAKQSLPELERSFYIAQVVDSRIAKDAVGEVQLGMFNNKAKAVLKHPLETELLEFITAHHPQRAGQVPVILRVNKFWVYENTSYSSESGSAELQLDFIYPKDDQYYLLYSAKALAMQNGLDVTKKHEANIANALLNCLKQFASQDMEELLSQSEPLTLEQVMVQYENSITSRSYPILEAPSYTKGVYMSFEEFGTNAPSITADYEIKQRTGFGEVMTGNSTVALQVLPDGKTKPIKGAWGYSDGQYVYIHYSNDYFPMQWLEGKFTFTGPPENNGATAAVVAGGVAGGLIGGAIAGGIVAATSKPAIYSLDLETGRLSINSKPLNMKVATAQLILYRVAQGEQTEAVSITIDGQQYTVGRNDIIELELSTTNAGTSICVTANEKCITFMPSPDKTYYISCSLGKNAPNNQAQLKEVDEKLGTYEVKGTKFARQKEEKQQKKRASDRNTSGQRSAKQSGR